MKRKPRLTRVERQVRADAERAVRYAAMPRARARSEVFQAQLVALMSQRNPPSVRVPYQQHVNLSEVYGSQHNYNTGRWVAKLGTAIRRFVARGTVAK